MKKIVSVVGARPQFIKCAPVSRELRQCFREVLVHTGQHYDDNMSGQFFRQLGIPHPDYELNVGSGKHGAQTGDMLKSIEAVLDRELPDIVLVYGDTNSTLAAALAAAKLRIPVAHVEAGLRSFNRTMPEEINRVLTDHVSEWLFCPTDTSVGNLAREGIKTGVSLVGDVMFDAVSHNRVTSAESLPATFKRAYPSNSFALATVHRAENTDDADTLRRIATAFGHLSRDWRVVWPVHPRTRARIKASPELASALGNVQLLEPASYLEMLWLTEHASVVLTDSGGLQKEAYWLGTPCVTLRNETEWVETLADGRNRLAGSDTNSIIESATSGMSRGKSPVMNLAHSAAARIALALG